MIVLYNKSALSDLVKWASIQMCLSEQFSLLWVGEEHNLYSPILEMERTIKSLGMEYYPEIYNSNAALRIGNGNSVNVQRYWRNVGIGLSLTHVVVVGFTFESPEIKNITECLLPVLKQGPFIIVS